jgi:hypothetical protein
VDLTLSDSDVEVVEFELSAAGTVTFTVSQSISHLTLTPSILFRIYEKPDSDAGITALQNRISNGADFADREAIEVFVGETITNQAFTATLAAGAYYLYIFGDGKGDYSFTYDVVVV